MLSKHPTTMAPALWIYTEEIVARNLIKKDPVDPYAQEPKTDKRIQPAVFHLILVFDPD
jgi:hypothetical protein